MCGICGLIDYAEPAQGDLLEQMVESIRHRGPDSAGTHIAGPAGLGHARLSILDLSPAGHQPMLSPDGDCALVYNGEIYNYQEIMGELQAKGYRFRGHSDTETLLYAYQEWGPDVFARFEGMFAFALWDARTQELHLARDRFGIKPLYYYLIGSSIAFGSEIKAILASGRLPREVNWQALNEYLHYGNAFGTRTLFAGVEKLLPGHRAVFNSSGLQAFEYNSIYDVQVSNDDEPTSVVRVRELLDEAVRSHLISDTPVGVFLSGGIDSSTMAALASRHYEGTLSTYSVGFDFDKGPNELPKARLVAEHFGTDHHELHIEGGNMPDVIEHLVCSHDEPFGDIADVPLYLLCRELRGSVKVILQGDGGDEIFAGYRRYNVLADEKKWHLAAKLALPFWKGLPRNAAYYRYYRFLQAMAQNDPAMRMALLLTEEPLDSGPLRVCTNAAREAMNPFHPYARYREFYERFRDLDPVQRMLYTDCGVILPDQYFEKVDKATMAHGIEIRVPMVDTKLTRYVMGLPSSLKVRRRQKKWVLREAMRGIVPDQILDAPKCGFSVPYAHWLRTSMAGHMRSVLLDSATLDWGVFDRQPLEGCIDEHIAGKRNNGYLLYKLLVLALWRRFYLEEAS